MNQEVVYKTFRILLKYAREDIRRTLTCSTDNPNPNADILIRKIDAFNADILVEVDENYDDSDKIDSILDRIVEYYRDTDSDVDDIKRQQQSFKVDDDVYKGVSSDLKQMKMDYGYGGKNKKYKTTIRKIKRKGKKSHLSRRRK